MTATTSRSVSRHPLRGILWGVIFGIGLSGLAISFKIVALGTAGPVMVFVLGVVLMVVWSMVGPAKKPAGTAPSTSTAAGPAPLDDFDVD